MLRPSVSAVIALTLAALPAPAQVKAPPANPPGVKTIISIDSARTTDFNVSPDGKWVVYAQFDKTDLTTASIWMASTTNPKPFRVTAAGFLDRWPQVSPTGDAIYFTSNRPNRAPHSTEVYVMAVTIDRATGRPVGPLRQITTDSVVIAGNISPDGKWMAYMPRQAAPLKLISTNGGNARTLVMRHLITPGYTSFSADGKFVVYQDSGAALRKVSVAGGSPTTLVAPTPTTLYALPYPGRDDRYLFQAKSDADTVSFEVRDLSGHTLEAMRLPKSFGRNGHVRSDGLGLVGSNSVVNSQTYAIKRITFATGAVVDALPVSDADLVGEAPDGSIVLHHTVKSHEQFITVSPGGKHTEVPLGPEIDDVKYLLPGGARVLALGKDTTNWPKDRFPTDPVAAYVVDRITGASRKVADVVSTEVLLCYLRDFESDEHALELAEIRGSNASIETIDGNGTVRPTGSMPLTTFQRLEDVAAWGTRVAYADSAANRATVVFVTTGPGKTPVRLAELPSRGVTLAWSPDGRKLAAAYGDKKSGLRGSVQVFDVAADGSPSASGPVLDLGGTVGFAASMAWLPDASAVVIERNDDEDDSVVLRPLDPARPPIKLIGVPNVSGLAFEPGGKSALFSVGHAVRGSVIWTADFVPVKQ